MSDKSELDNFLERSVVEEVADEPAAAVQEAAAADKTETTETTDKGEGNAATPAAEKDSTANDIPPKGFVPVAAQISERKKRQELERELEAYRKPKPDDPDMFAEPERFKQSLRDEIKQESFKTRIDISREILLEAKPDYAEKEAKFIEMAKADPGLVAKLNVHANPAKFAYETAVKQLALDEIGDPVAYREKLKQEILAELKGAETPEVAETPVKKLIDKAPSLATASAARTNTDVARKSLEDLFDR